MTVHCRWLGRTQYSEIERLQEQIRQQVLLGDTDRILLTEHDSVYVRGRREFSEDSATVINGPNGVVPIVSSKRGGLQTYHGPGQLMAYVIMDIKRRGIGIPDLVWTMEQAMIDWLDTIGVHGERVEGAPGIWVDGYKIGALGLHFKRWVSMYGLCLNLDPNLRFFKSIRPCGYSGELVTSVRKIRQIELSPHDVWEDFSVILTRLVC